MKTQDSLKNYFFTVKKNKLSSFPKKLPFYLDKIYGSVDFSRKRVLDIGAGNGLHSFYAAVMGASEVIAIEPEAEGSRSGYLDVFRKMKDSLDLDNVKLYADKLQNFKNNGEKFDIVISHYSINHLNEKSCREIKGSKSAQEEYIKIFSKIYALLNPDSRIIITDCSSRNFFSDLGLKNPFAPTINWKNHQPPEIWCDLLKKAGFKKRSLSWLVPCQFGKTGDILLGNKAGSYFSNSHFSMIIER